MGTYHIVHRSVITTSRAAGKEVNTLYKRCWSFSPNSTAENGTGMHHTVSPNRNRMCSQALNNQVTAADDNNTKPFTPSTRSTAMENNTCNFSSPSSSSLSSSTEIDNRPQGCETSLKQFKDIPGPYGVKSWPVIGTILALRPFSRHTSDKLHLLFRDLHRQYGEIVRFPVGLKEGVFLFNPQYIHKVVEYEGPYPYRLSLPLLRSYEARNDIDFLSTKSGEDWLTLRRPCQHAFSQKTVESYLKIQSACADDLVMRLQEPECDARKMLLIFMTEASTSIALNNRLDFHSNRNENEDFFQNLSLVFELMSKTFYTIPLFLVYRTPLYIKFEEAMNNVIRFCRNRIKEAEIESMYSNSNQENLFYKTLQEKNLPQEYLVTIATAGILGGVEMTAQALIWCLWILGLNQDKQELLYQEVMKTCGHSSNAISPGQIRHMPYLKACVKEIFRMVYPSSNGAMRVLPKSMVIADYIIPENTNIFFGNNTLCQSDKYFDNPELYLPERWLPDAQNDPTKRRLMSMCVLPFGLGKRNCVGRRLGEQLVYTALIKIIQKLKVSVHEESRSVDVYYTVNPQTKQPIKFSFTKRQHQESQPG